MISLDRTTIVYYIVASLIALVVVTACASKASSPCIYHHVVTSSIDLNKMPFDKSPGPVIRTGIDVELDDGYTYKVPYVGNEDSVAPETGDVAQLCTLTSASGTTYYSLSWSGYPRITAEREKRK